MQSCLEREVWLDGLIFPISFFPASCTQSELARPQTDLERKDIMTAHAQDLAV